MQNFLAIGPEDLDDNREVHKGDKIKCPNCGKYHVLKSAQIRNKNGTYRESEKMLFYDCGKHAYLAAINNQLLKPRYKESENKK